MNALHHIIDKIATNPRLANVPRPILDAVAELALTTLVDGLTCVGKGDSCLDAGVCCLEDLRVCEGCEAISGDVHDWGEVQLCATCRDEEQACAASPTGKHEFDKASIERARHLFDGDEPRCLHCRPRPSEAAEAGPPAE